MSKLTVYLDIDGTILDDPGDETRREDLDYQLVCEGFDERLEFMLALWLSYRTRLDGTQQSAHPCAHACWDRETNGTIRT